MTDVGYESMTYGVGGLSIITTPATLEKKTDVLRTQLGLEADFPSTVIIGLAITALGRLGHRHDLFDLDKPFYTEMRAKSWTYEEDMPAGTVDHARKVRCLESMADACIARLGISAGGGDDKSVAKEQVQEMGADGLPKPRIFVTEMVGGKPWGTLPPYFGRYAYTSIAPRLIEYPTISELKAMSTEQLQALRFTAIGWKVRGDKEDQRIYEGLDALKFWRNDGEVSAFYGASQKLNHTSIYRGDTSKSFKTAAINSEVRGVKVFFTDRNVIGLALLGEGGQVLAQEGPGKSHLVDHGEYYYHAFLFGVNEKLVGFKFYSDSSTPRLGCILADMGTPQEGGVIDPALVPVYLPPLPPIAVIYANVRPDPCGGAGELWRFSEAAKPHNMPPALRAHLTEEDYGALMDSVNAVLDRYGAPKETDWPCQGFCRVIWIDGPGCGILNIMGFMMMPLIFPLFCFEMYAQEKLKKLKEETEPVRAAFEAKGLVVQFSKGTLAQGAYKGGGPQGTYSSQQVSAGHPSSIIVSLPRPGTSTTSAPQPMVMGERVAEA